MVRTERSVQRLVDKHNDIYIFEGIAKLLCFCCPMF